ncbi:MAG TPA: murein biosynthesis integral membrane protein MurJ [Anaerolineaceae bacterium]|nr:murein biosynthesis integral membrane protein MurJ [Anaerolineaceae bacterium]HPN52313.1 murein biosynthesis integral membrane protein MurJ [Anaerolineaceae bacterium]
MTDSQPSAKSQIARAAGTVMAAFIFSNLVGLVRGIVLGRAFGTSGDMDAFNAANRVTEMLFNLMAGGALGSAFIPTFSGLLSKRETREAWKLASAVANLLLMVLSLAALLAAIFAPQVVRYGLFVLAPGQEAGQEALTVDLLRIMLPSIAIFGLSGLVMGILNAHQRFLVPALAPAMYSLGMIGGTLLLPQSLGIHRLAWGALAGSGLHLLVQIPSLFRLPERRYWFILGRGVPAVREVLLLMGPRLFGVAVVQLNFIVNTVLALSQAEGSATAVALAFSLMLMPQAAVAQSIAIAALPTFSRQVSLGRQDEMRSSLAAALRGILLLALPAAVGLILLREPIIAFLYEKDAFTAHSTQMVAWALLWYAVGLPSHSVYEILSRAFYALHDTRTPVTVGVVAMGLNIVMSFGFSALFGSLGLMPHGGLALANSTATTLEMLILLVIMRRRLNGLDGVQIWRGLGAAGLGSAVMGGALLLWLTVMANQPRAWIVLGGLAVGVGLYGVTMLTLRVNEPRALLRWIWARLARRVSR